MFEEFRDVLTVAEACDALQIGKTLCISCYNQEKFNT